MRSSGPNPFPLVFGVAGFALAASGIWWIYRPAALIAGGLMCLALAYLGRRGNS